LLVASGSDEYWRGDITRRRDDIEDDEVGIGKMKWLYDPQRLD
jgi:hypothetical protein